MNTTLEAFQGYIAKVGSFVSASRERSYLAKAVILFTLLFVIGRFLNLMPTVLVVLFTGVFAAISAMGFLYSVVDTKAVKQIAKFKEGEAPAKFNNKRGGWIVFAVVISFFSSFSLLIASADWTLFHWLLITLLVLAFLLIASVTRKKRGTRYYKEYFVTGATLKWSTIYTWLLIAGACIALVAAGLIQAQDYSNILEAYQATKCSLTNAASTLVHDAGTYSAIAEIITEYAIPKIGSNADIQTVVMPLVHFVTLFLTLWGVMGLMQVCYLRRSEMRRPFSYLPISDEDRLEGTVLPLMKSTLVLLIVFLLLIGSLFMVADSHEQSRRDDNKFTEADKWTFAALNGLGGALDGEAYYTQEIKSKLSLGEEQ